MKLLLALTLSALIGISYAADKTPTPAVSATRANALPVDSIMQINDKFVAQDGKQFTLSKRRGHPQVVALFYSSCKYVCPLMIDSTRAVENALTAADSVVIPIQCEYFALEGLAALVRTIEGVAETINSDLQIQGILRTMYDPRNSLTTDVSAQLRAHFGDKVYRTVVPRNVRLAEAPSHGVPAMYYDKNSRGSKAYMALAGEIIRREEQQAAQQPDRAGLT